MHRPAAPLPRLRGRGPLSVGRGLKRLAVAALAGIALLGALGLAAGVAPRTSAEPVWELRRTTEPRRTGIFRDRRVSESSGLTASRRQPGILWTHNDSGHEAWIYATDTLGRDLGAFQVAGARNVDWEAIALGPCGNRDCLYIADTGDNRQDRRTATIYRVPEPALPSGRARTARAEALEFRYPGGPRDVEAAFVDPAGTTYLITKGRGTPPILYRLGPDAWRADGLATAEQVGRLPIDSRSLGNRVTDAALSPSGDKVAVRTYLVIYLFLFEPRHPGDAGLRSSGIGCDAAGLQLQGEGLTWLDDRELVLSSEGGFGTPGTLVVLGCGTEPDRSSRSEGT